MGEKQKQHILTGAIDAFLTKVDCWLCDKSNVLGFHISYPDNESSENVCVECLKEEIKEKKAILRAYEVMMNRNQILKSLNEKPKIPRG